MFYVVATPIGNLKDITERALEVLKEVDLVLCEDQRRTKKLLNYYKIDIPTESYHFHSRLGKKKKIVRLLKEGKDLALVSDAGTPGVSDPGGKLIQFILEKRPETKISPIPGPSSILALASVSGFFMDRFLFLGYPPKKNKRKSFFNEVADSDHPVVFFEAKYRIIKTLKELKEAAGEKEVVVGRELTKKYETIYRGRLDEVIESIKNDDTRGEFTIIVKI